MITEINVNKPEPIISNEQLDIFDRSIDILSTIDLLEAGKSVLIKGFYSNGLSLLSELKKHLKKTMPNSSFQEQREFRAKYSELSNRILIEVVDYSLVARKSPSIGWFKKLYPETSNFLLPFPQIQGLNSSWQ